MEKLYEEYGKLILEQKIIVAKIASIEQQLVEAINKSSKKDE